jgi:hypothetical protein
VNYKSGEVSWSQTVWHYWGYLDGCGNAQDTSPDSEPAIDASRIISTLSGSVDGPS